MAESGKVLDEYIPYYQGQKAILIEEAETPKDWYTEAFRKKNNFYWQHVRSYLEIQRGLRPQAVDSIDQATTRILERLGDPSSSTPHRGRGLVVGYVQSGKTTNFTALTAKAIDAGYRLIIVLSGTTNLLRNQTQRRLDMELVGVENILRRTPEHEYLPDEAWPKEFITYGADPSMLQSVDLTRLTNQKDFKSSDTGINPLDFQFEKVERALPLFRRENLDRTGARLVVVKKQKDRLDRLLKDLKSLTGGRASEIPTLVIDDESDQASVNTRNPAQATVGEESRRTTINKCIVGLLRTLPRAQYVGYTATPFANVLVDPADPEDIYPKDFILSLERPSGYMGVREFHDLDPIPPGRLSNQNAYVRDIPGPDADDQDRLREAIDAFVLSGALKVFRESQGDRKFKHHTMLVHESPLKGEHQRTVDRLKELWGASGYHSPGGGGLARLKRLMDDDFRKGWRDRGEPAGFAFPSGFAELTPHLGEALDRIQRGGTPILMVNSAEGSEVPDFETKPVWKIIVGGAKLSRGYTVEGLTVSSFRRTSKMQDTLLQMGRWFGFREGYEDLVRLYIGRREVDGKSTFDLYKAFEAICRDEEDFREQLAIYQRNPDGSPGLTPKQVPALVYNSHPRLKPTGRNKMFNARLTAAAFEVWQTTRQALNQKGREENAGLFQREFFETSLQAASFKHGSSGKANLEVEWKCLGHHEFVRLLERVRWEDGDGEIPAEIGYLKRESPVDSWLILAPRVEGEGGHWKAGDRSFPCVERKRQGNRIGVFSSPDHVKLAKWLLGTAGYPFKSADLSPRPRTGVMLLYPTRITDEPKDPDNVPVMGFALYAPPSKTPKRLAWSVQNSSHPNALAVDLPSAAPRNVNGTISSRKKTIRKRRKR